MKKRFLYKVYDNTGVFVTTWNDVITEPSFSAEINGSFSELKVALARSVSSFGENKDVKYGNIVKVFVFDGDSGVAGVQIYSGMISSYEPIIDGSSEKIEIVIASWWWETNRYLLEGDGNGIDTAISGNGFSNDKTATMTGASAPSPNVVSESTYWQAGYEGWRAFDKSATAYWLSNAVTGWLKYDFGNGNGKVAKKYSILALISSIFPTYKNRAPKNWTFEGSNDNTNWVVLDTRTNEQDWGALEIRTFEFENDTAYRYYKLNVTANNGDAGYIAIGEVEIMEGVAFARAGATAIKYLSQDPSNILKDILDKFTAQGGKLDYAVGTVDLTGTVVSYTFNTNLVQEAIKKIIELCPQDWYFRVGADDKVYLKAKSTGVDHKFCIGRNVSYYRQEKRLENIVNYIYFKGKNFFKKYSNSGSVSAYGRYSQKIVDDRVTNVATADIMANTILNKLASPEIRITIRVTDNNNINGTGYDIESIKVGDTCKIFNATSKAENLWDSILWDEDMWDYDITNTAGTILQIQKITYKPDYVELEISNRQPDINKRIEDINRNLVDSQTKDNPVIPTT